MFCKIWDCSLYNDNQDRR